MTESLEAAVAGIKQHLVDIDGRLERNYAVTKEDRSLVESRFDDIEKTLTNLVALSNEWAGVRKTLIAAGAVIGALSAALGAIATWLRYGSKL